MFCNLQTIFYFRSNTFRCRFEKPFLNFHLTKFKCGIRDEITRISGNVNSTSGAQFALCHPVKVRDLRMGTVFT